MKILYIFFAVCAFICILLLLAQLVYVVFINPEVELTKQVDIAIKFMVAGLTFTFLYFVTFTIYTKL